MEKLSAATVLAVCDTDLLPLIQETVCSQAVAASRINILVLILSALFGFCRDGGYEKKNTILKDMHLLFLHRSIDQI